MILSATDQRLWVQYIIVLKNDEPVGLVQSVDTEKKRYLKTLFPSTSTEEGNYDRLVINKDTAPLPEEDLKEAQEAGVEIVTTEDLKKLGFSQ